MSTAYNARRRGTKAPGTVDETRRYSAGPALSAWWKNPPGGGGAPPKRHPQTTMRQRARKITRRRTRFLIERESAIRFMQTGEMT